MFGHTRGWSFTSAIMAAVLAGASLVGGCANDPNQPTVESLTQENTGLRTENAKLKSDLAAAQTKAPVTAGPETTSDNTLVEKTPKPQSPAAPSKPAKMFLVTGDEAFGPGSVDLKPAGKKRLDEIAAQIKAGFNGRAIRVEAFTDTDPPKRVKDKYPTNEALSLARAETVAKYLHTKGIATNLIEAIGRGAANPKATKAESRRVEIVVVATGSRSARVETLPQ